MGTVETEPLHAPTKGEHDKAFQQFLIDSEVLSPPLPEQPVQAKPKEVEAVGAIGEVWKKKAACKDVPKKYFYSSFEQDQDLARRVCGSCAVRSECTVYAVQHGESFGIWGGYDFNITIERSAAKAATKAVKLKWARRESKSK